VAVIPTSPVFLTKRPKATPASSGPRSVIDPRIDVHAQFAIQRMRKSAPPAAQAILADVKSGALGGIYKEDEAVPARAAKRHGRGWWEIIPSSQAAVLLLDAAAPFSAPPLIVFRDGVRSDPAKLDPALLAAWRSFRLWRAGRLKACPGIIVAEANTLGTRVPNVVPHACLSPITLVSDVTTTPAGGAFTLPPDPANFRPPARKLVQAIPHFPGETAIRAMENLLNTVANRADGWVYMANWHAEHDLRLPSGDRLRDVLSRCAASGATIRCLLWDGIPPAIRRPSIPFVPASLVNMIVDPIDRAFRDAIKGLFGEPSVNRNTVDFINTLPKAVARRDDATLPAGSHHQKILVAGNREETVAIFGGVDWNSDRLRVIKPGNPLFDISLQVNGAAAVDVAVEFERRWNADSRRSSIPLPTRTAPSKATRGGATVQIGVNYGCGHPFASVPHAITGASELIENLLRNCRKFFYMECQYGLGNAEIEAGIRRAFDQGARFGVVVLAGTAVVSDFPEVAFRRHEFWSRFPQVDKQLLVFERFGDDGTPTGRHAYVHSKLVLVDDLAVSIGTLNLSRRSWRHDSEITGVVSDARVVQSLRLDLWPHHLTLRDSREINDPITAFSIWQDVHAGRRPMPRIRPLRFAGAPPPRFIDTLLAGSRIPLPSFLVARVRATVNGILDTFHDRIANPIGPSTCLRV
jgi:phosphatidylserine/phosphatidylglycerophosphate/cardiolipin synthase-like enzyme